MASLRAHAVAGLMVAAHLMVLAAGLGIAVAASALAVTDPHTEVREGYVGVALLPFRFTALVSAITAGLGALWLLLGVGARWPFRAQLPGWMLVLIAGLIAYSLVGR